jgi:hypothetical protein
MRGGRWWETTHATIRGKNTIMTIYFNEVPPARSGFLATRANNDDRMFWKTPFRGREKILPLSSETRIADKLPVRGGGGTPSPVTSVFWRNEG